MQASFFVSESPSGTATKSSGLSWFKALLLWLVLGMMELETRKEPEELWLQEGIEWQFRARNSLTGAARTTRFPGSSDPALRELAWGHNLQHKPISFQPSKPNGKWEARNATLKRYRWGQDPGLN